MRWEACLSIIELDDKGCNYRIRWGLAKDFNVTLPEEFLYEKVVILLYLGLATALAAWYNKCI